MPTFEFISYKQQPGKHSQLECDIFYFLNKHQQQQSIFYYIYNKTFFKLFTTTTNSKDNTIMI